MVSVIRIKFPDSSVNVPDICSWYLFWLIFVSTDIQISFIPENQEQNCVLMSKSGVGHEWDYDAIVIMTLSSCHQLNCAQLEQHIVEERLAVEQRVRSPAPRLCSTPEHGNNKPRIFGFRRETR